MKRSKKESIDDVYEQLQKDEERLVKMMRESVKAVYGKYNETKKTGMS
jgi:hypothetical protein